VAARVLWLAKGLGPGGAERLLVELAGAIDHDRVDVTAAYVLPWKDHLAGELEATGVRTICLSTVRSDRRWPQRLRRLLATERFDVVHAHSPVPATVARLAVRILSRADRPALMTTEHNTWDSHRLPTRWANRLTGRHDRATLAVTAETLASLRGPAAPRAEVLVHGVDLVRIRASAPAARARVRAALGLGVGDLAIGTVANFRAQKDYPNLLGAARLLVDRGVAFRIVAVGQGPLEREITARRDELGLAEHVLLAGFRADAVDVMAACDVFVLASAWEGLPVAVMEALALGLPVVATRVGGVAESLGGGDAVLVPPRDAAALADALQSVLKDPQRRADLTARSRAAAPKFDIAAAAHVLTGHYERLAAETVSMRPTEARLSPPSQTSASQTSPAGSDRCDPPPMEAPTAARSSPPRRTGPATPGQRDVGTAAPAAARRRAIPDIRAATAADRDAIIALLGASLGWGDDDRYRSLFAWKHETNPFGPSPAWIVEDGGDVVAVRLFMRWAFLRGGVRLRAVRAVDTATHPDHQGRGLFKALTLHALEACRADEIDFVFNTPNEQSRPGYLKMGWRQVGRLPAAVRPRGATSARAILASRVPADRWSLPLEIGEDVGAWLDRRTPADLWTGPIGPVGKDSTVPGAAGASTDRTITTDADDAFTRWRYGLAELAYRVVDDGTAAVVVRLRRRGAATELAVLERLGDLDRADALAATALREVGATHATRLGAANLRHGWAPLPGGGPILTWRAVNDNGPPPLPNWGLQLRDIELF